jgi:predicted nucleotidyltransferase
VSEYAVYKQHWKQRAERERRNSEAKARDALKMARRLAELLVREFGAARVYLYGSLVREGAFHLGSDIDLAAQGIPPTQLFRASVALARAADYRYRIELVDLDTTREGMRSLILSEGMLLSDQDRTPSAHS